MTHAEQGHRPRNGHARLDRNRHDEHIRAFCLTLDDAPGLGQIRRLDRDADLAPRRQSAAHQGRAQCRRGGRAGRHPRRPASLPSAGGAAGLARCRPRSRLVFITRDIEQATPCQGSWRPSRPAMHPPVSRSTTIRLNKLRRAGVAFGHAYRRDNQQSNPRVAGGIMKGNKLRLVRGDRGRRPVRHRHGAGRHDDQGRPRRGRGRYRRLGRLYRARRQRQELRLGHRLREADRLQGQRQDRRHLRRDGLADERRRLRSGDRLGRRHAAPDRRQDGAGDQHRPDPELEDRRSAPAERRPGTRWTAITTACPISGGRTC